MSGERYSIELRALKGETPVTVRLRHALKQLLRQHGFLVIRAVESGTGRCAGKDGTPSDPGELASALADRAGDLADLLIGLDLPADLADDVAGRLAGAVAELDEIAAEVADTGP